MKICFSFSASGDLIENRVCCLPLCMVKIHFLLLDDKEKMNNESWWNNQIAKKNVEGRMIKIKNITSVSAHEPSLNLCR